MISVAFASQDQVDGPSFFPEVVFQSFLAILIFSGFLIGAFVLRTWVRSVIYKKQGDQHEEVAILYSRITFSVTLVVGFFLALIVAGAPLEWFSGGIGLGLAFALRPILANFFAGIILLTNDKFNLGDVIEMDSGEIGRIVDIQSRATSIRLLDHSELTIPNTVMLSTKVRCYTKGSFRCHEIEIGVGYATDLKQAEKIILQTLNEYEDIEKEPAPFVLVQKIASSAVIFKVRFWLASKGLKWWLIKSDVLRAIFENLKQAGVEIPYPVQTLRVDSQSSELLAKSQYFAGSLR